MVTTRSKRLSTLETGLQPVRKRGKSASSALNDSVVSEVCEDGEKCYYLLKSEPESAIRRGVEMKFSIDDLAACEDQTECWDGVRNYEARNNLRSMNVGDHAFFYPDNTAFEKNHPHYDSNSTADAPRWFMVDVQLVRKFSSPVTLDCIKQHHALRNMQLVKRGRVSVQIVRELEWNYILRLADGDQHTDVLAI